MEFDWRPEKAERNRVKHDLAFEEAVRVFVDPNCVTIPTIREADREERFKTIGDLDGRLHAVVWTQRGPVTWIISARPTNAKEDRAYAENRPDHT